MKKYFGLLLIFLLSVSCQSEQRSQDLNNQPNNDFELAFQEENAVKYDQLKLYPILGSEEMINKNEAVASLKTLKEAIEESRFRITEKKPFGRFDDQSAVNTLTVQNRTEENVFLMSGDLVQGGLQDRVLASNRIILPRTITDISVFCVEKGRWRFQEEDLDDETNSSSNDKKIVAFKGYYNVASSGIRKSIRHSGSQEEVWQKVSDITSANQVSGKTSAYASLESADNFTQKRDEYLSVFKNAFSHLDNVVGIVALSGSEVLGTEVFGHPDLFFKQYEALIHSYITDAITHKNQGTFSNERLELYGEKIKDRYQNGGKGSNKLMFDGALVYFSDI